MRNQNQPDSSFHLGKPGTCHKKFRKFEVLTKYNSSFHHKRVGNKELNSSSKQNYTNSIDKKNLSKTLLAYYSVHSDNDRENVLKSPLLD